MHAAALETLIRFVEGRMAAAEFERAVQGDSSIEALLADDPELPPHTYVGSSVYLFLLQLDLSDPGDALSAQGAVSDWLRRHSISHSNTKGPEEFYRLLLAAQPRWLDVDAKWLQENLVEHAGDRKGERLKRWLHDELLKRFRFVSNPPTWLQNPTWPIGTGGPLVFLGQLEVRNYFHDQAVVYVFHDPASGECTTVIQVA